MNLPQQTTDESHNLLAALLVMLDGMATPGSPPIDKGGLSIGFYLFMLEHANVTHAEAEGLVKRFRALVAAIPTAERRAAYMTRCVGDLAAWRTRLDAAEVRLADCFHGFALA